jgi:succinoglycan biosynthesis protein ExoA
VRNPAARSVGPVTLQPTVTVIIPMRNERDWIRRSLTSVFAQNYPAERFDVIVVDGMSDDGSFEILQELAAENPRLRVLRNPACIVPSSLNRAIRAAGGEIIARVDMHTMLAEDYLSVGVETLRRTGAENVGGPMVKLGGGKVGDAIAAAMSSRFGVGSYFQYGSEEREADTVYMGMWPREAFEQVGLFDEELIRNQDDEFNYRLRKHGGRIIVTPRMRSSYQNRQSWQKLTRQFYEYGVWKARVLQKHPAQMSVRHYVPPAFDLAVICGLASSPLGALGPALSLGAICAYLLVVAVVAMACEQARGNRSRLVLAFVLIHQAWALGFLVGMVRFAPRWFKSERPELRLTGDLAGGATPE